MCPIGRGRGLMLDTSISLTVQPKIANSVKAGESSKFRMGLAGDCHIWSNWAKGA